MSRLTDAEFIYAPAQIALASLYLASSELAEQWARAKGLNQTGLDVIKDAAEMIGKESKGGGIDVELVREVDRRLRLCKNPEKIPGTKALVSFFT
jgi:cyclin H